MGREKGEGVSEFCKLKNPHLSQNESIFDKKKFPSCDALYITNYSRLENIYIPPAIPT